MSNNPYDGLVPDNGDADSPSVAPINNDNEENTMNGKPIVKSKTFWVNLITAVAGVLTTLGGSELVQDNPEVAGIAATVLGVVNVVLRLVTKDPVSVTTK